jgi:uncharacterized protein (TIGR02284 family)
MRKTVEGTTETLNALLEGEISAVETYQQALGKVGDDPEAEKLREIHQDHTDAVAKLRDHVVKHGGEPSEDSGAWGTFAKTIEGAAKLLGDATAVRALKQGEEKGLRDYDDALSDENLPQDCQTLIRDELRPRQRSHIETLDRLIERM